MYRKHKTYELNSSLCLSVKSPNINPNEDEEIEQAIGYNSASTERFAKRKIIELLKTLINGDSIVIEDIGVELKTIEEYKSWKRDREYLNTYNTDQLIAEIKLKSR